MKKENRRIANWGNGDFLIVHEGLQNSPEIIKELKIIKRDVDYLLSDECNSHLSDVGLLMSFKAKDLEKLAQKCFEAHKIEQNSVKNEKI